MQVCQNVMQICQTVMQVFQTEICTLLIAREFGIKIKRQNAPKTQKLSIT